MKVLTVTSEYPPGLGYGIGRYVSELSQTLAIGGHEVHVVTIAASSGEADVDREGVQVHYQKESYPFFAYNAHLQTVLENLPLSERVVEAWDSYGPFDLISVHGWMGAQAACLGQRLFGCPLVAVLHGTEAGRIGGKGTREELYVAEMEKWLCGRAERIVVSCADGQREVEALYAVEQGKIAVVSEGVQASCFETEVDCEEFRSMFAEPDEDLLLLSGRLCREKGPDVLLQALPGIVKRRPRTRVVVAGEGPMKAALIEEAERLGVSSRVRWTGHLGTLVLGGLYQVADALIVPSRYEAFGRVVLEGLIHQLPVVASRVGGIPGIASANRSEGLQLFEAGDVKALERLVVDLLRKKPTRKNRDPRPGQNRVSDRFGWAVTGAAIAEIYTSLCPARV
jgi:glycosyltransferase involved in cell wall biosynthesis